MARTALHPQALQRVASRALCLFGIYAFVSSGVTPYVQAHRLEVETANVKMQLNEAQTEKLALERQVAALQTPEGEALVAREYGWVRKGEVAISGPMPNTDLSRTPDSELLRLLPPERPDFLDRVQSFFEW